LQQRHTPLPEATLAVKPHPHVLQAQALPALVTTQLSLQATSQFAVLQQTGWVPVPLFEMQE
jgi:DNA topoisomerase VI subunit B